MLTESLEPILLEVNANPSLYMMHEYPVGPGLFKEVPSKVDKHIKKNLIKETMILAAPRSKVSNQRAEVEILTTIVLSSVQASLQLCDMSKTILGIFSNKIFKTLTCYKVANSLYK